MAVISSYMRREVAQNPQHIGLSATRLEPKEIAAATSLREPGSLPEGPRPITRTLSPGHPLLGSAVPANAPAAP